MSLDTGVNIRIDVTGEKLLKQAFDSVRLAAKGLEAQGLNLSQTLKKLEGEERETINTFRKSSETLKSVQKETVLLSRQQELLAKFTGLSKNEARMLAAAQDELSRKAKELNASGAARISFIDSQNKKIVEQIRLNNQLRASIDSLGPANQKAALEINKVQKELSNLQRQTDLMNKGLSSTTARGVVRLQSNGATQEQINQFIQLRKQIDALSPSVNRAGASFSSFSGILRQIIPVVGAVGLGSVLTQAAIATIRVADSMSLLKSRMKLTMDETQDFDKVYKTLIDTSIENRASLSDTVTLFNRLTPALRAAGLNTSQTTTVIDSFQKTLLISGATVRETSSAILQFSQAMAAGRLNGDEFRSISEAAPEFLRAFSRATNVAAGSLKELAADGKLTTEIITAAMIIMNSQLEKTAKGIDLTFGQSIQILGTRLSELVDRTNEATGFTKSLADATFQVSEIVKSFTDVISNNKEIVSSLLGAMGTLVSVLGASAVAYAVLKTAVVTGTTLMATYRGIVLLSAIALNGHAAAANTAAAATARFGLAIKGVLASTGIGAIAVILGTAAVALSDYIFAKDEATEKTDQLTEATKQESEEIQKAELLLKNFGITYGSAAGAAGVYTKKTKELTDAYVKQKVGAEGLYLIEKNLLELERGKLIIKAAQLVQTEKDIKKRNEAIEGVGIEIKAINDLLGIMELTEEQRKAVESAKKNSKADKEEEKVLSRLSKQIGQLLSKYQDYTSQLSDVEKAEADLTSAFQKNLITAKEYSSELQRLNTAKNYKETIDLVEAYNELAKSQNKVFEESKNQTKAYEDQVFEIEKQILAVGKNKEELLLLEQAKINDSIATIRSNLANLEGLAGMEQQREEYRKQISELEKLKDAKNRLAQAEENAELKKEFQKIFDDVGKIFGEAIFKGGNDAVKNLGKSIKDYFRTLTVRLILEPALQTLGKQAQGFFNGSSLNTSAIGSSLQTLSAGAVGGSTGAALSSILKNANTITSNLISITGASGQTAASMLQLGNSLSSIAPYAGSIANLIQGDVKSAAGSALGTYIGGAIAGPIGAAIGSFLGSKLGGGGKISASNLSPSQVEPIKETLLQTYESLISSLGGTSLNPLIGIGGNTGRQGQNPNFSFGATVNGRLAYSTSQQFGGDGLFLRGEIQMTEAKITEQITRASVALLKLSDFADNIDAVFVGVNPLTDSIEKLNAAVADAQLLNSVNVEFKKLGGVLSTLVGASLETVKSFIALGGGIENLSRLQSDYISVIYSQEEQLDLQRENLNESFKSLGVTIPKTTDEFRSLVEAQNLSTAEGQVAYIGLLQLAGAFREITEAEKDLIAEQEKAVLEQKQLAEESAKAVKDQLESLRDNLSDVFSGILAESEAVNAARDQVLGINSSTGSFASISQRIQGLFSTFNPSTDLSSEILRFSEASTNAVGSLSDLREETVRYFEQQKALSELMKSSASNIRSTISGIVLTEQSPLQQLQTLQSQFTSLTESARLATGSDLASIGSEVNNLIGPLLEKAAQIYASGPEFQRIKELVLGQANAVADQLDALAPENYQQESLTLLDQIDQSLIALKLQSENADALIVQALGVSSSTAVSALNQLGILLTGSPVASVTQNAGASLPTVGIVNTADVNATQTGSVNSGSFAEVVNELRAIKTAIDESDINIKVVTSDGKTIIDETLTQIKARSKKGELVIYADGVK
jgi:tape measure domain-containing protein